MHRSRVGIVVVDHPEEVHEPALRFWAGVVGGHATLPQAAPVQRIGELAGSLGFEMQRTGSGTPSRIHLDIETDDISAEVTRVLSLGATVERAGDGITVMRDPGGLLFCVVGVQTDPDEFRKHATIWDAGPPHA